MLDMTYFNAASLELPLLVEERDDVKLILLLICGAQHNSH